MAQLVTQGKDEPVTQLQDTVIKVVERLVLAEQHLQTGMAFWGRNLTSDAEVQSFRSRLTQAKSFLESLQPFNSAGKLKSLKNDVEEINGHRAGLKTLAEVESLQQFVSDVGSIASYLATAEAIFPQEHPWVVGMKTSRDDILSIVSDPGKRATPASRQQVSAQLAGLKKSCVENYMGLHTRARLGVNEDKRKAGMLRDERLGALQKLSTIDLMPRQQLVDLQNRIANLKSCFSLTDRELDASPLCPHCGFRPDTEQSGASAGSALDAIDADFDNIVAMWTQTILTNLKDPTSQDTLALLKPAARKLVEAFMKTKALPDKITPDFIAALQEALMSLTKIEIRTEDLRAALAADGSPAKPEDMKKRFENYVDQLAKGKEPGKVRIVLS
jgi:hypothetical protein